MQQFRNLKNSILFKIFAAFIALSFILFGVSNFLMAPTQQWIAKIDNIKITHRQMQEESRKYRNLISRQLSQEQLLRSLFPIGELTKPEVRAIASK